MGCLWLTARAGLGVLTHGRARRAGFDGVGVPGLDQDPNCRGVVFLCTPMWRPMFLRCIISKMRRNLRARIDADDAGARGVDPFGSGESALP